MSNEAQAAVVSTPGAAFDIQRVVLDGPRADEVLVRMVAAGICHTDIAIRGIGGPQGLPLVLGHEGAGVIEEVGAGVAHLSPGDKVLLSFNSCGQCVGCRDGHPAYCDTWVMRNVRAGLREDGSAAASLDGEPIAAKFFGQSSFSSRAIVDVRSVVRVDADADLSVLAPLGCGVQTGFGAVWNVLRPTPGQSLAVFGCGAVGLSSIMAAALAPLGEVVAIDRVPARLELARELGATHTIDTSAEDALTRLRDITGGRGVDLSLETTANPAVLRTAIDALAARGTCAVVGSPAPGVDGTFEVSALLAGKKIVGVTLGDGVPQNLLPVLVDLHARGRLPLERIVRHYDFADINIAADDMLAGRTVKPVIRF